MAKRAYTSQFYADDKDVFDLLISLKRGMNTHRLLQFARDRGILLSDLDDREELVRYLSQLPLDWYGLQHLFELTDTGDRAEKTTSSVVTTTASLSDVEDIVRVLEQDRSAGRGEVFQVHRQGTAVVVNVQYTELDPTKARLSQRRSKAFTLRVEQGADGLKFRHDANERAEEIVHELVQDLEDKADGSPVQRRVINLSGVRDSEVRTNFFLKMMNGIKGYKLSDVTSVSVDRVPEDDSGDRQVSTEGEEAEDLVAPHARAAQKEAVEMMGVVKSVLLKGQTLLRAPEYSELKARGFFISYAVWTADELKPGGATGMRVEYEAEFSDGPNAADFRYNVRGIYNKSKKGGELKRTRDAVAESDRGHLMVGLEEAAQRALAEVEAQLAAPPSTDANAQDASTPKIGPGTASTTDAPPK